MILLDTHALVWWLDNPALLGSQALLAIENALASNSLYVSSITAWEITLLYDRGRLQLTIDAQYWLSQCERSKLIKFVPVNNAIAIASVRLPDFPHADPADRIIVATALELGAQLVTKDEKLRTYKKVRTIW